MDAKKLPARRVIRMVFKLDMEDFDSVKEALKIHHEQLDTLPDLLHDDATLAGGLLGQICRDYIEYRGYWETMNPRRSNP